MLFELQQLAKKDRSSAEIQLLSFVQQTFPEIEITSLSINQSAVSLNSVNGYLVLQDGTELFFKFHSEEGEESTIDEYYNSEVLKKAGLPMLMPKYQNTQPGSQFLIYEKISAPTLFEVGREIDQRQLNGEIASRTNEALNAESQLNRQSLAVALATLKKVPAGEQFHSPLHQLFYARLNSTEEKSRLDLYYTYASVRLPDEGEMAWSEFSRLKWIINGVHQQQSLAEIIAQAQELLNPLRAPEVPVLTAHGDDHNGNKFLIDGALKLFDPAFASDCQPALLACVKTTFHDTMAHPLWLYEPKAIEDQLDLNFSISADTFEIDFEWPMTLYRRQSYQQKVKEIWLPLLADLKSRDWLDPQWKNILRKALFCCPFLVTNLTDPQKFSAKASLLALAKSVQLGSANVSDDDDPEVFFQQLIKGL
jgi:hypothetical protein